MTGRIPKRVFRIIVLSLLLVAVGIWINWLVRGTGPYTWLQQRLAFIGLRESQVLGALLAFILVFVVWMIPTLVLRYLSDMPPLHQELALTEGKSLPRLFKESLHTQQQTQAERLALPAHAPSRRRFFQNMGWVGIGVGLGAWFVTWLAWYLSGQIWPTPLAVGIVGVLGGLFSVISGRPIIFDRQKVHRLQNITKRVEVLVVLFVILFLIVVCVLEALNGR